MALTPCLYFKGDCEQALRFYAACGLGEVVEMRRIGGTPLEARHGAAWRDKVLFVRFEGEGLRFAASDGPDSEPMKGCAFMIENEDAAVAQGLFDRLSDGGVVEVAFQKQFWGDHYGNFTDRFGVQWAVNSRTGT